MKPARQQNSTNHLPSISRRLLLKRVGVLGLMAGVASLIPACGWTNAATRTRTGVGSQTPLRGEVIDLAISETRFILDGRTAIAMTINGTIPGPVIRLKEG